MTRGVNATIERREVVAVEGSTKAVLEWEYRVELEDDVLSDPDRKKWQSRPIDSSWLEGELVSHIDGLSRIPGEHVQTLHMRESGGFISVYKFIFWQEADDIETDPTKTSSYSYVGSGSLDLPDLELDDSIREMLDGVKEAIDPMAESLNNLGNAFGQVQQSMSKMQMLGKEVVVKNTDGSTLEGVVVDVLDDAAGDHYVGENTLVGYWHERGHNIYPDEAVFSVNVKDSHRVLDYPESKVELEGGAKVMGDYSFDHSSAADLNHEENFICPTCEDEYLEDRPGNVEGDQGELYCSLECLNEAYQL